MRRTSRVFLLTLLRAAVASNGLLVACLLLACPALAQASYQQELQHEARLQNLANERFWHLLLHYQAGWTGGVRSQADGDSFFLAADGRTDPAGELEADLAAFFSPAQLDPNQQHPQCAFAARYAWLKERLSFDAERLPEQPCADYQAWRATMDPAGVTLVFASAFLNAPASMYGHTFLRFDRKRYARNDLLANVVSYTASMPPVNPLIYTYKGIMGGFRGVFQAVPYYVKVREYSDVESRDLWEYHLNIPETGIEWMLRHVWELDNTHFDYYFFDENCAYHILSLLEVADPHLHLLEHFPVFTIPIDTVRAVLAVPGLVKQRTLRRAKTALMSAQLEALDAHESRLAKNLVQDLERDNFAACSLLPQERKARVLEAALSYFQYAYGSEVLSTDASTAHPSQRKRAFALVHERSDVRVRIAPSEASPPPPPESGHRTSRVGIEAGAMDGRPFVEVSGRMALHDLLDPQSGYTPDSALEMAAVRLRAGQDANGRAALGIEALNLFRITSITPASGVVRVPSWRAALGWGRPPDKECLGFSCGAAWLTAGVGWALETNIWGHAVAYAFADAALAAGPGLQHQHRISAAGNTGILWQGADAWRLQLEGGCTYPLLGDRALLPFWQLIAGTNWAVTDVWSLRVEASSVASTRQASAGVLAYF